MKRVREFMRDEQGAALVAVTVAIVLIFAFAVLAVDTGILAVVKTQLQNAADAGVLAGVTAFALNGDTTLAINRAIQFAGLNKAIVNAGAQPFNHVGSVAINAGDVTFPEARKIRVTTHRTTATGDPIRTYFLRVLDPTHGLTEMTARASAKFFWVCGVDCLKPWAPPDRWFDADSNNAFNPDSVTNPLEYYDPLLTGYTDADLGTQITLKLGNGNQQDFGMDWYYAIDFPALNDGNPVTGGDRYREWIAGCADGTVIIDPGDSVQVEPGNMVGPTNQGLTDLINLDPNAVWDAATGEIINSAFPVSPRILKAALFDPSLGIRDDTNGRKYLVIVKIIVMFIEGKGGGGEVTGRFIRLNAPNGTVCEDQSLPTFLYKASLVE